MPTAQYDAATAAANRHDTWTCPRCNHPTGDFPALSRKDNASAVCSQCGTDEAMRQWSGLDPWPAEPWPFLDRPTPDGPAPQYR